MKDLLTPIYPFGFFEDDGTRTLREEMYQAPFVWYSNLQGVEKADLVGVQRWHIEPQLKYFNDADQSHPAHSGEFALMRLPEGIYLHTIADKTQELERVLLEAAGWRFATMRHVPLFAEVQYGRTTFGDTPQPCRYLWCLGSPVSVPTVNESDTMSVKVGPFHRLTVPALLFPFLSWDMDWTEENKKVHGWGAALRATHWTNEAARPGNGGIPLLLYR